jgi:hypothetical protein
MRKLKRKFWQPKNSFSLVFAFYHNGEAITLPINLDLYDDLMWTLGKEEATRTYDKLIREEYLVSPNTPPITKEELDAAQDMEDE